MGQLRLVHLTSLAELRANAAAWDDLWLRSEATIPMARAELTAQWVEQFAPQAPCHTLLVANGETWLSGLLLVGGHALGLVPAGRLPSDFWISGSGFLLDARRNVSGVLDLLVAGTRRLPWPVLWLDEAYLEWPCWRAFQAALLRAKVASSVHTYYRVPHFESDHRWESLSRRCSKKFREQISRSARRLAALGDVQLVTPPSFDPETLEAWLRRGFEVEHRNWKGRTGRSVLREGMFPYILRQALQLAEWGQLHLAFLQCGDRTIAFAYGAVGKGVYHSIRIGYDEEYVRYSPGHLLRYQLFRQLWCDPAYRGLDFTGGMTEAQSHWKPPTYAAGDLVVAPRGLLGRAVVHLHRHWLPYVRHIRRYLRGTPAPREKTASADITASPRPVTVRQGALAEQASALACPGGKAPQ